MSYSGRFTPKNAAKYLGDVQKVFYRSLWELRFMKYCDDTPGVTGWSSEELIIPYISPVDGHKHRYFPDFFLQVPLKTGGMKHFVIEIKPKNQAHWPTSARAKQKRKTRKYLREALTYAVNEAKWEAATKYCAERHWVFLVLTEDHLFNRVIA